MRKCIDQLPPIHKTNINRDIEEKWNNLMPFSVVGSKVNISVFQHIQTTVCIVYFLRYHYKTAYDLGVCYVNYQAIPGTLPLSVLKFLFWSISRKLKSLHINIITVYKIPLVTSAFSDLSYSTPGLYNKLWTLFSKFNFPHTPSCHHCSYQTTYVTSSPQI